MIVELKEVMELYQAFRALSSFESRNNI